MPETPNRISCVRRICALALHALGFVGLTLTIAGGTALAQNNLGAGEDNSRATRQLLAAQVRGLNNSLLRLHGQAQHASPSEAGMLHGQAATVIRERAAALSALIREDAREALSFAFSPELLADLAQRFPTAAAQLESHGTWQGPVEYLIIDDADMKQHRTMRRMKVGQQTLEVYFAAQEPKGLKSGDLLQASGVLAGTMLAAADGSVTGNTLAAAPATCSTTGVQNTAVLLVTFPGATPPTTVTPQSVHDIFFGTTGRSLDGFWREASYSQTSAAGNVFGWYTLTGSYSCSDYTQLRNDAIAAASAAGVNFQNYSRLFFVFPDLTPSCGAGIAMVGCYTFSSPAGTLMASTSYLVADYLASQDKGVELVTHEAGHNLGLGHASSRDFVAEALGPLGATGTLTEYGDKFSTMGSWNLGHYTAPMKAEWLNWMSSGANYQVVQASSSWLLQPLETSPASLQALKIQRGTGNDAWLWIEYRQPVGNYDPTLSPQPFSGALIHYQDSATPTAYSQLLDFTPQTDSWLDPALVAGNSWVDPYTNLSLSIQSATQSGLTVNVNYGAVPCTHANPTLTITPLNPSIFPGNTAGYDVAVKNNDAAGCPSSTFNLSSTQPSGWPSAFSAAALTLSSGQSGSATMSKTGPMATPPGTYPVDASAANASFVDSDTANVTVMAPLPPLTVGLSVPASTYPRRSTVSITATALDGSNPAAGASVVFTLIEANGSKATKKVTADSTGTATWNYRIGPKDPTGTASVTAQATYGSQTATSSTATFTVQ